MTVSSNYTRDRNSVPKACAVTSILPGVSLLKRWTNSPIPGVSPGSDGNNSDLAFGLRDAYGVPITNTNVAPSFVGNVSGFQVPNTAGYQVSYSDAWLALPPGVNTVRFSFRGFGNTSAGLYVGYAPKYSKRVYWNNVFTNNGLVDASIFPLLCNCRILYARTYTVNGYFNGGHWVTWDVGAGLVDVPVANTHGAQPSQSQYP